MTPFPRRRNPYVNRMAEDMQIRNLAAKTIDSYTWHVDKFCSHFGKMPEELGPEEIRQYQIFLVHEKKVSWSSFNQAVCALRFLYEVTLGKAWAIARSKDTFPGCGLGRKHVSILLNRMDSPCPNAASIFCSNQRRRPNAAAVTRRALLQRSGLQSLRSS